MEFKHVDATEQAGSASPETPNVRRHLLIAGTGRSGTSFLVRYFSALGMATHLDRAESWDDTAQAGLEDSVLHGSGLPYVIKSPWLYEYIDQVLERKDIIVDAVVIPMRDLVEASVSRIIVETQDAHHRLPFLADETRMWKNHCRTPGGALFSLNPVDQARLLAAGFHDLVNTLVRAEVPIRLVAFPRIVEDFDYLFRQLQPILPASVDKQQARRAFDLTADRSKVRTSDELAAPDGSDNAGRVIPSAEAIELAALRRELKRLRLELAAKPAATPRAVVSTVVPLASEEFLFAAEILPGRPVLQRWRQSVGLRRVTVKFVTFGRDPSSYAVQWRIVARGDHDDIELGTGMIQATTIMDWLPISLPLSVVPVNPEDEIEICFATDAADTPVAPIGVPLYSPLPDTMEPPAEIGGQRASAGAQIGLTLTYRHSST